MGQAADGAAVDDGLVHVGLSREPNDRCGRDLENAKILVPEASRLQRAGTCI